MRVTRDESIERAFLLIQAAAVAGERCPQTWPHGPLATGAVSALVEAGRIRSEVYAHNWRVVTILKGDNRGRSTAPPPRGGRPYLVNGVHVDRLRPEAVAVLRGEKETA